MAETKPGRSDNGGRRQVERDLALGAQIALVRRSIERTLGALEDETPPVPEALPVDPASPTRRLLDEAVRISEERLTGQGPIPRIDVDGEARRAIDQARALLRHENDVREWVRSLEVRSAIREAWGPYDVDRRVEDVLSAALAQIASVSSEDFDVHEYVAVVIRRCVIGTDQMVRVGKFLDGPGRSIMEGRVRDDYLPGPYAKGDLPGMVYEAVNRWRLRLGGAFDYLNMAGIVTKETRNVLGHLWRKRREVPFAPDDGDGPIADLFVDDRSAEDEVIDLLYSPEYEGELRTAVQDALDEKEITVRLGQALLIFIDEFEAPSSADEKRRGGQRELDAAVYRTLRRLERKPLERDGLGRYTPAVRGRKAYLQKQIVEFIEERLG